MSETRAKKKAATRRKVGPTSAYIGVGGFLVLAAAWAASSPPRRCACYREGYDAGYAACKERVQDALGDDDDDDV